MRRGFVLDANVAAKWFLPGPDETLRSEALEILESFSNDEIRLVVPDLFWPEIGNVFWKAIKVGRMTSASAEAAISALSEISLPTAPCLPLLSQAFAISTAFGSTVYDSLYVALAIARKHTLLTADERLVNALGQHFPVLWLGSAIIL